MLDEERLSRERDFHNARFSEGDQRHDQLKYYWSIRDGAERYIETVKALAVGKTVLEYGCGIGENAFAFGHTAADFQAIDISDTAIEDAKAANTWPNVQFHVMDAMNMTFETGRFDLVFGSGIVHHLDTDKASSEVARVLKPGGRAIFWEPMGLNPLINAYRWLTPSARTPDEHPLLPQDFRIMRGHFSQLDIKYYGLATLASVPLRNSSVGKTAWRVSKAVDEVALQMPGLRSLAWYCLLDYRK